MQVARRRSKSLCLLCCADDKCAPSLLEQSLCGEISDRERKWYSRGSDFFPLTLVQMETTTTDAMPILSHGTSPRGDGFLEADGVSTACALETHLQLSDRAKMKIPECWHHVSEKSGNNKAKQSYCICNTRSAAWRAISQVARARYRSENVMAKSFSFPLLSGFARLHMNKIMDASIGQPRRVHTSCGCIYA